jgi:hypothetical protein
MSSLSVILLLGVFTIAPAFAQTLAPVPPPSTPVNKPTTPEDIIAFFEGGAKRRQDKNIPPALRSDDFRVALPVNNAEFAAVGKYSVMLHVMLTQKPDELPVKRIYIRANGQDSVLQKLSGWRSELDSKLLSYKMYGRYREDGFYLLPVAPMLREGMIMLDLSTPGLTLNLMKLPDAITVKRGFPNSDPAPGSKPDPKALRTLMEKKFKGFPMPQL